MPADLAYLGAFRVPDSPGTPDNVGWEWGGSAMAYHPGGDPSGPADGFPGSLFGAGHDQTQHLSEIDIPVPVISPGQDVDDLNTAQSLQGFTNVRGSLYDHLDWEMPRVGLAYLPRQGSQATDKLLATNAFSNENEHSGLTVTELRDYSVVIGAYNDRMRRATDAVLTNRLTITDQSFGSRLRSLLGRSAKRRG